MSPHFTNHIATRPERQLLAGILRDALAIYRAGQWHDAQARCLEALADHRIRSRQRGIGCFMAVDLLAADLAKLIGADRNHVREVARETLIDNPLLVVSRELRVFRSELNRNWRPK